MSRKGEGKKLGEKKLSRYVESRQKKYIKDTREKDGKTIKVPSYVKDEQAYLLYIKLHDELTEDPDYVYQTSDPDVDVHMLSNSIAINRRVGHLPQEEQDQIYAISQRLKSLSAKVAHAKKKAFGNLKLGRAAGNLVPIEEQGQYKKFFQQRGAEIVEYFGRYFTLEEVHKVIRQDWGYPLALNTLRQFRIDSLEKINERQEEFKRDYSDVRLGYKRSRLDELSYLFVTRKDLYSSNKKLDDSKELRAILEQIRKEVEGDSLTINGTFNVNHDIRVQQQVSENLMKEINLKALILSRVAAKFGKNPVQLQYQLINSYYSKFSGYAPPDSNILTDEIIYPSALIYDFDMVRAKHNQNKIEEAEVIESSTEEITKDDKQAIDDARAAIMKRLIEQKKMNRDTKENIDTNRFKDK